MIAKIVFGGRELTATPTKKTPTEPTTKEDSFIGKSIQ